ncbi:MAG: TonB-dependent receptor [Candidatus Omnitrophica bacterium]|nr:TonB-dependent receptor [Candidatus Omnitrophota bacterium]
MMRKRKVLVLALAITLLSYANIYAATSLPPHDVTDITSLSVEELMSLEIYSAAKKPQAYFDTPNAIYVITPEDIRRSGATNIPDLLRMVPGVSVQQMGSGSWDISIRGFNGFIWANKLLVLIDGRSVYTPLYGGVYWATQNVVLEDIERIEIIRGPGGTLWGANAVNGVINIITKSAKHTQGALATGTFGSELQGEGVLRYSGEKDGWYYRTYGKYFERDDSFHPNGADDWDMTLTGIRLEKEKWTTQADFYQGDIGLRSRIVSFTSPFSQTVDERSDVQGWNLMSKYEDEDWLFQMYWDVTDRRTSTFGERRDTVDMEYSRRNQLTDRQQITIGGGYRLRLEKFSDTLNVSLNDPSRTDQVFNLFTQDEITVIEDKLKFIVGTKLEHNIYTGLEVQPNARLSYQINNKNILWGAVSRAIRMPTRIELDSQITSYSTVFSRISGNPELKAEEMIGYEVGYRTQPTENSLVDVSLFSNSYDNLITYDFAGTITEQSQLLFVYPYSNGMDGEVYGTEVSAEVQLAHWWKLKAFYAYLQTALHTDSGLTDVGLERILEDASPRHNAYLRSSFDLPRGFELDITLRGQSSIYQSLTSEIPAFGELDFRLAKNIKEWEFSLVGQNLLNDHHPENKVYTTAEIERGGYVKIRREF